jgi:HemY protein
MRRLFFIFVILLAAILLGLFIHADPGYVLIVYRYWTLETTLWTMLLLLILSFAALHIATNMLRWARSLGGRISFWNKHRRSRRAARRTMYGLHRWLEGEWAVAEKKLVKAAKDSKDPIINYLTAARAAQEQGHFERRDDYFRKAYELTPGETLAVGLAQANLQLEADQLPKALATLNRLKKLAPHNAYLLKLLYKTYLGIKDWDNLCLLLPLLHKYNVLTPKVLHQIEKQAYQELLKTISIKAKNLGAIKELWDNIPSGLRSEPELLLIYTRSLVKYNEPIMAEKLLGEAIKHSWNSSLVEEYGNLYGTNYVKQLKHAEGWLAKHEHDPALLLCLGRLCKKQRLWGKAKNYLEASLAINPEPATYNELGLVMEMLNNKNAALEYYRKGLKNI